MGIVSGLGLYEHGRYSSRIRGKGKTREYHIWKAMMDRCSGKQKCYTDCSASENFKNFQYFAEWCNNQIGFENTDWQLDKDILVQGNRLYSENTCCFVPSEINTIFKPSGMSGVCFHSRDLKYTARCNTLNGRVNLGYYEKEEDAYSAYVAYKQTYLRTVIDRYRGILNERVIQSLEKWRVDFEYK